MAKASPFRFSTQYQDDETDLLMYVHRPYGASQGRFLSADPLGELGFETLRHPRGRRAATLNLNVNLLGDVKNGGRYAFVRNTPVNDFDYLGLLCGCQCGDDVTSLVYRSLIDIARTYAQAGWWKQCNSCSRMFDFYTRPAATADSWDLEWLVRYPMNVNNKCDDCKDTVTFQGKCVGKDELNYIMYGWGMILCDKDEQALADWYLLAVIRRLSTGEPLDKIARKVEFARYGWTWSGLPSWVALPQCDINTTPGKANANYWRWEGLRE